MKHKRIDRKKKSQNAATDINKRKKYSMYLATRDVIKILRIGGLKGHFSSLLMIFGQKCVHIEGL